MSDIPKTILMVAIPVFIIWILYLTLSGKNHHHKRKNKHKNKNIQFSESYISKTKQVIGDLNVGNDNLIEIAKNYVNNRESYDSELDDYITKARLILSRIESNERSASSIFSNIMESSSAIAGYQNEISILNNAVINSENDSRIAIKALDNIEILIKGETPNTFFEPSEFGEFGDFGQTSELGSALNDIEKQQNIAKKSYLDIQNQIKNVSSIYNTFNEGIQSIFDNLISAKDSFERLNNFIEDMTGNINKAVGYNNLQLSVNQATILINELEGLGIDNSNQYYTIMQNLVENLKNSRDISNQFLSNVITIFTEATKNAPSEINNKLLELEDIHTQIKSLIGITGETSMDGIFGPGESDEYNIDELPVSDDNIFGPGESDEYNIDELPDFDDNIIGPTEEGSYTQGSAGFDINGLDQELSEDNLFKKNKNPNTLREGFTSNSKNNFYTGDNTGFGEEDDPFNFGEGSTGFDINGQGSYTQDSAGFDIFDIDGVDQDPNGFFPDEHGFDIDEVDQDPNGFFPDEQGSYTQDSAGFDIFNIDDSLRPNSILDYYNKLLEINIIITREYNSIINYYNIIADVINKIQLITEKIIRDMDSNVNTIVGSNDLDNLQDILLQYFPSSTKPPIYIPPLNTLIDVVFNPIEIMTTVTPYTNTI